MSFSKNFVIEIMQRNCAQAASCIQICMCFAAWTLNQTKLISWHCKKTSRSLKICCRVVPTTKCCCFSLYGHWATRNGNFGQFSMRWKRGQPSCVEENCALGSPVHKQYFVTIEKRLSDSFMDWHYHRVAPLVGSDQWHETWGGPCRPAWVFMQWVPLI
jgi:hypothetical protein